MFLFIVFFHSFTLLSIFLPFFFLSFIIFFYFVFFLSFRPALFLFFYTPFFQSFLSFPLFSLSFIFLLFSLFSSVPFVYCFHFFLSVSFFNLAFYVPFPFLSFFGIFRFPFQVCNSCRYFAIEVWKVTSGSWARFGTIIARQLSTVTSRFFFSSRSVLNRPQPQLEGWWHCVSSCYINYTSVLPRTQIYTHFFELVFYFSILTGNIKQNRVITNEINLRYYIYLTIEIKIFQIKNKPAHCDEHTSQT